MRRDSQASAARLIRGKEYETAAEELATASYWDGFVDAVDQVILRAKECSRSPTS